MIDWVNVLRRRELGSIREADFHQLLEKLINELDPGGAGPVRVAPPLDPLPILRKLRDGVNDDVRNVNSFYAEVAEVELNSSDPDKCAEAIDFLHRILHLTDIGAHCDWLIKYFESRRDGEASDDAALFWHAWLMGFSGGVNARRSALKGKLLRKFQSQKANFVKKVRVDRAVERFLELRKEGKAKGVAYRMVDDETGVKRRTIQRRLQLSKSARPKEMRSTSRKPK